MKEWIFGRNPVYEVLRARRRDPFRLLLAQGAEEKERINDILSLAATHMLRVERVPRPQIDALAKGSGAGEQNAQGVALEASGYPYVALPDILEGARQKGQALFVLVLDVIQNPQNLGTLLRTAEAVGVHGVLLPLRRAVGVTPAVVHASSGASEHLLVAQANLHQAMAELKESGAWVIGLDSGPQAQPIAEVRLDGPLALVVGSEGEGMRSLVRQSCDVLVRLPMLGKVESLNAAVAGSVALYLALNSRIN
jgi:23S rRNA (guanosine2251-2'-O)-methyltransferase